MFKSDTWRNRYFAAYDAALQQWPVEVEAIDVETTQGRTRLTCTGAAENPPLLLLPGGGSTATIWLPIIGALSERWRCYAVDTVGDFGRSEQRALTSRAAAAKWLAEVLDAVGVERAPVIGLSYGAFLALNFAHLRPDRVEKVVVLVPAGTVVQLSARFGLSMLGALLCPGRPRGMITRLLTRGQRAQMNEYLVEQSVIGLKGYALTKAQQLLQPDVFTDEELREVTPPALLITASDDWTCSDPAGAVDRFKQFVPQGEAEMIEDCGHVVIVDYPEHVLERVSGFLCGQVPG